MTATNNRKFMIIPCQYLYTMHPVELKRGNNPEKPIPPKNVLIKITKIECE
jgi:hypothetical protein